MATGACKPIQLSDKNPDNRSLKPQIFVDAHRHILPSTRPSGGRLVGVDARSKYLMSAHVGTPTTMYQSPTSVVARSNKVQTRPEGGIRACQLLFITLALGCQQRERKDNNVHKYSVTNNHKKWISLHLFECGLNQSSLTSAPSTKSRTRMTPKLLAQTSVDGRRGDQQTLLTKSVSSSSWVSPPVSGSWPAKR